MIIFGSVFLSKKVTKPKFFFLKKKPKPGQTDRFRFGSVFLGQKPVQTGLARFFRFWLGFFGLAPFWLGFSGLARLFSGFLSVLVRFGSVRFFRFFLIKPKPNRTGWFFQKYNRFNRFFFRFGFFGYFFFPVFSV